eukprot:TRINITY_DN1462_c0_g1_i1.p1 TRINITY_DN1462_c0_g1~~TRINITY_DN1462_c0_g1_i1.p1  ORF type:complete len:360 (-),score=89.37 TRINITY_DN1462_c0_g1_i1:125-1204(-)
MGDSKQTLVFGAARQVHIGSRPQGEPNQQSTLTPNSMSSTNLQGTSPPGQSGVVRPPRPHRAMPPHTPPAHPLPAHPPPSKPIPHAPTVPHPPPLPPANFTNNLTSSSQTPTTSTFMIVEEPPVGSIPDPSPSSPVLRPYWLMRMWLRTMVGGGYLTPRIYVPPSLWLIDGCKFAALQTKITTCEGVLEDLLKLKSLDITKIDVITKELDICCTHLDSLQNTLHMHLSFVAEIKGFEKVKEETSGWGKIKKIGGVLAKGAVRLAPSQRDEDAEYIQLLQAIFEESQFLTDWLSIFGGGEESSGGTIKRKQAFPAIIGKIHRVSEFFMEVLCAFVVRDLNVLIERYMKKNLLCFLKLKQK